VITRILHALVSQPVVYDWVQRAAGVNEVGEFLSPHLAEAEGKTVLDVGAGTGIWRQFMPKCAKYLWLDCDPQKLDGYREKHPDGFAVLGSGTTLCFSDKSVDFALVVGVAHHLDDSGFSLLLEELARVIQRRLIFLDPVACRERAASNLLWRYDRGRFPRTPGCLHTAIDRKFQVNDIGELTILHRYTLCVGQPRN
jgi:SAM-dependent methyltransferase